MIDSAFCCLPIDIAVRLIGTISLLTNALVFIVLVSDSGDVLADDRIRIIFGFNCQFFAQELQLLETEWFSIFCFAFIIICGISSALLIWASITLQRWLTVPWLFCSVFNVVCHFASLILLSIVPLTNVDRWITAFTVFYSVTILYFTLVVAAVCYSWRGQLKETSSNANQEFWENIYKSPPLFESPYKNQRIVRIDDLHSLPITPRL